MNERPMTEKGELSLNVTFDPSENIPIEAIKRQTAELIAYLDKHGNDARATAKARTAFEDAAMWAARSIAHAENEIRNTARRATLSQDAFKDACGLSYKGHTKQAKP